MSSFLLILVVEICASAYRTTLHAKPAWRRCVCSFDKSTKNEGHLCVAEHCLMMLKGNSKVRSEFGTAAGTVMGQTEMTSRKRIIISMDKTYDL